MKLSQCINSLFIEQLSMESQGGHKTVVIKHLSEPLKENSQNQAGFVCSGWRAREMIREALQETYAPVILGALFDAAWCGASFT
jgi:hypothetical protein